MKKFDFLFLRFLKYGTLITTLLLVGIVSIQIYSRFFMENAPAWTEELSRMVFIYLISFAAALGFRQGYFIKLDLWHGHINSRFSWILDVFSAIAILVLFTIFFVFAIKFMFMGLIEHSPGLAIRMAWSFGAMVLLGFSMSFYAFLKVLDKLKG